MIRNTAAVLVTVLLTGSAASAATSVAAKCQSAKNKEAGSVAKCRQAAEAKRALTGDEPGYADAIAKCATKFSDKWAAAEQKAIDKGGSCQTTGDYGTISASLTDGLDCVAGALDTGDTTCLLCGNGVLDGDEECDFGTLDGQTCSSVTGGAEPFGNLACSGCVFDTSDCHHYETIGGANWTLASTVESCDSACAADGLVYNPATQTYAGSSGSDANCFLVLAALDHPAPVTATSLNYPFGGMGCVYSAGNGTRDTDPTSSSSFWNGTRRACACM